jgi:putative transposase
MAKLYRTCKVKLGKSPKQEKKLKTTLELLRQLYNAALQQRREAWVKQHVSLTEYDQHAELTKVRADDIEFRNIPVETARLTSLHRLALAFQKFFNRLKRGEKPGYPRYKGVDRFNTLFYGRTGWKIDGKKLILVNGKDPIVLRMRNSIYLAGKIVGFKLVERAGRWWAHFQIEMGDIPEKGEAKNSVGIDVGIKTFATLSDGSEVEHPHFLVNASAKLKEGQRNLSRKTKGSNNRKKAQERLARLNENIVNQRKNFINQVVSDLVKTYDGFVVEALDIRRMMSTNSAPSGLGKFGLPGLKRGIIDSSWGAFALHLVSKAEEAGCPVVCVNPRGTSQMCSGCGTTVKKDLGSRMHDCPVCGLLLDRDLNAAKNIFALGKNNLGHRLTTDSTAFSCAVGAEAF